MFVLIWILWKEKQQWILPSFQIVWFIRSEQVFTLADRMENQIIFCELKLHHKRDFKAKQRCCDCNKYLCAGCAILHRNDRKHRHHVILDIKPGDYLITSREILDASPRINLDASPRPSLDTAHRVSFDKTPTVSFYNGYEKHRETMEHSYKHVKKITNDDLNKATSEMKMTDETRDANTSMVNGYSQFQDESTRLINSIHYKKHMPNNSNERAEDQDKVHGETADLPNNTAEEADDNITNLNLDHLDEAKLRTCPLHPDKEVEYFCEDHYALACGKCAIFKHRKCEKLTTVEVKLRTFEHNDYMPTLTKKIASVSNHVAELSSKDDKCIRGLERSRKSIPKDFEKLKSRIVNALDKLEQTLTENADVMADGLRIGLHNHKEQCHILHKSIKQSKGYLEKAASSSNGLNKFVVCFKVEKDLETFEKQLFEVHKEAVAPKLTFKVGLDIDQMLHDFTNSLEIGVRHPKPNIPAFPVSKHLSERNAVFLKRFSARTMSDESCPRLCGSAFLPYDKIALVDHENKKLKIFHKNYVLLAEKEFDSAPWGVVLVNETCVAVSLYEEKSVQVLRFGGFTLAVVRTITSKSEPYALAMLPDMGILATFDVNEKTASIGIVTNEDTNRRYLKKFPAKTTRNVAFNGSLGLIYNDVKSTYYVSSYVTDRVTAITNVGAVSFIYEHTDLIRPFGLSCDGDGNIYVCSTSNSKIHQVLPNGNLNKFILTDADGVKEPLDISFNEDGDVFLVTCENSDAVRIYKLE